MDTPTLPQWATLFSHFEYQIKNLNDRYTEIWTTFREPGFASAEALSVHMPAAEVTQLVFEANEPIQIGVGSTYEEVQSVFCSGRKGNFSILQYARKSYCRKK